MADNLDIGLGNGLRNVLAESVAQNNLQRARYAVSSTFLMLIITVIPVSLLASTIALRLNWYSLLNVSPVAIENLPTVVSFCTLMVGATFIFKFVNNVYLGLQLPAVSNLLVAIGQTFSVVGLWGLQKIGIHSLLAVAAVTLAPPLISYLGGYIYTFLLRYRTLAPSFRYFEKRVLYEQLNLGIKFFAIQIGGIILFQSGSILISKLLSPEQVTPFQVVYRYFSIPLTVYTVIGMGYWSASTDAYTRADFAWLKHSFGELNKATWAVSAAVLLMAVVAIPIISFWISNLTHIPRSLTLCMAVYIVIIMHSLKASYFLNGMGRLKLQIIHTFAANVIFIPLAIAGCKFTELNVTIPAAMCIANLPGLLLNHMQINRLFANKAHGLWNQ